MIEKLVRAPINTFFDITPKGQIYNRLSGDIQSLSALMLPLSNCLINFFGVSNAIIICAYFELSSLLFIPIFLIFGLTLTNIYLPGMRELTRVQGITRSPIIHYLGQTVSGAYTIRAFNYSALYAQKFYKSVNALIKLVILSSGASNWYGMYMDFCSIIFIAFLTFIIIIYEKDFTPQSVGLMLTHSFLIKKYLFRLFDVGTGFENSMVAMERCNHYIELKGEKEKEREIDKKLINWPCLGRIEFLNYSVKYRPNTEVVVKNLSFKINSREKIGVVGRTGCGKSTLILGLFRLLEPLTGTIKIDEVDIVELGLDILRNSITIIPQDPSLMKGSLRYNMDPFNKYTDIEIKDVFDLIGSSIHKDEKGLEKEIKEMGLNLSVGERQIICICRAILRVFNIFNFRNPKS
jgi:ABC-type multidrug transport system fused ATPase/permease subunit